MGGRTQLDGSCFVAAQRKTAGSSPADAGAGARPHKGFHESARRAWPHRTASVPVYSGVPVEIVGRTVADWVQSSDEKDSANEVEETKKEDWFLVRGLATRPPGETAARAADTNTTTQPGDQTVPISGWVIARFIELDLPEAVREGASSANLRPLAWFELNRVSDPSGDKPQYLVAAARGPEGQACDFTALRVYTWYVKKERYETAFIENDLCGQMPIRIEKGPKGEPEFRFHDMDGNKEERVYRLNQTVVRRIREGPKAPVKHASTKPAKPASP